MRIGRTRKTLKDIAGEAKLSIATVSQILNDKPCNFSSEETKIKVKNIAQAMGYRPNIGYKIMMGAKTKTVAIVISIPATRSDEHIQKLILLLSEKLLQKGYASYVSTLTLDENENISVVEELVQRGVEHFVMIGSPRGYKRIQKIFDENAKTHIGYNSVFERNINFDVVPAVEVILKFFLSEKRVNFKMLLENNFYSGRFTALKNIFKNSTNEELQKKYVVPVDNLLEISSEFDKHAFTIGYETTRDIIEKDPSVRALFYLNDYFAVGGLKYLVEKHYEIGRDIAIAGFNNIHAVRCSPFPISSVEHNIERISELILNELFTKTPFKIYEKPEIHIRK